MDKMKKQYYIGMIWIFLLMSINTFAYDVEVGGIYYNLNTNDKTAEVTNKNETHQSYSGVISIPSSISYNGLSYIVSSIGKEAFRRCGDLTSVSIPNSVMDIYDFAFAECGINSIIIPYSVVNISSNAFQGCDGLSKIVVNSGNTIYDSRNNCNAVIVSSTNKLHIGCKSTVIPNSVTSIGNSAFANCKSLTSIVFPNSIISIGAFAFSFCSGLSGSLIIPGSITAIGQAAFQGCSGLSGSLTIPNSVKSIGDYAFSGCSGFSGPLTIPSTITSIGNATFQGCSGLTGSLIIPNSVESIGNRAFTNCSGFTGTLSIPKSVKSIGDYAFSGCSGFTGSLTIHSSLTSIGERPFSDCGGLENIFVEQGNIVYDSRNNCNAIIISATNELLTGCKNTIIPNNISSICDGAFMGCKGLTSLSIPNNVTKIGGSAFRDCINLSTIFLPNSLVLIDVAAFAYCKSLTTMTLPNKVRSIGQDCFFACSGLTSVTISNNVTSIGNGAFSSCKSLAHVKSYIEDPFNLESVFYMISSSAKLEVPKGTKSKYQALAGWSKYFKEIVEFDDSPTTYTLSISASGNGSASYGGNTIRNKTTSFTVNQGSSATISFAPDNGYRIKSVKVNNSTVTVSNNQYTISNIKANTTVSVEFEAIPVTTYTLSITASGNGSVSYGSTSIRSKTSSFTVNEGTSATITFSPDNGYRIKSVKVNNSTVSVSNNQYTISNINANTTISVEFEAIPVTTYTLSIRVSGNGSASYNGTTIRSKTSSFTVNQGSSVTITFSSDNEYQIQSVKVNGSTVTVSNNQYTISNISQNTSVEVEFTNMPTTGKFEVDGLCYNILSNNTVELTWRGINNPYVGDVVVPENVSYNGNIYRIVKIGEYAFVRITDMSGGGVGWGKSDGLTSVKLPSTLLTIGSHAFSGCISLTSLTIPTSVTSIESWACDGCFGLSSITIPNSVMNIGICAFYRCESLSSILIPSSVTNIGYSVFDECRNLASIVVEGGNMQYDSRNNCNAIIETSTNQLIAGCKNTTIPSSVTRIGYAAFCRCIGLTSITIPSSVVSIGGNAFYGCIGLSSITIPSSVTTIESGAFYGCLGFTSITIPNSVSSLGYAAFSGCNNLESVISYIETPFNIDRVFEKISASAILQVPKGTKSGYQALSGWADYFNEIVELNSNFEVDGLCYNILSDNQVEVTYKNENGNSYSGTLVIPEKVQYGGKEYIVSSIGDHAFYKCENITGSLTIPNSVTSIGNSAFWGCSGFTGLLAIPNSVTSIGNSAFSGCSGFTGTLTIPNSVTSIGKSAFSMCSGFTGSLTIPNSVTSIGESAFYECRGFTGSLTIPNTVSSIGLNTFRSCGFTGSLVIPNSVTSIGDYAFYGCSGLTGSLTIPNTVSFIGKYTFSNCGFTGSLFIPSSVTSIRESAFSLCTGFTGSLSIPSSVTSIGNSAFLGCSGLTSLIIPESVTSIGYSAFEYCKKLILVKSQIDQPFSIDDRVFQEISSVAELKVPKGTISKYQALSGWTKHFKEIVEFSDSPTFYSLTIEVSGNGFASYDGTVVQGKTTSFTMNEGSSATITFTPNDGYQIKDVKVNGSIVSVSNSQYTISGIYKDITVEVEFEEILQAFSVDNVNYTVVSVGEQTIRLTKGNYNMLIEVPAIVSYQDAEWTVTGIDNGALANNSDLAAIIWHPEAAFTEQVSNPNLLLYVDKAEYAPSAIKNVVVNGSASSITLTDAANGNDFYCPQEFTAQRISYTHNYSMKTGIGKAQGWETIALPFDVQKVTHQSKGEIVSFAKWKSGDAKKPFWLMELNGSGWKMAESIKANTPYIISMPNNEEYKSGFLLNGSVTFSAENVNVVKTENLSVANYSDRTFVPTFASLEKSNDVLALNVVNDIERVTGGSTEGSTFERNLRPIHPFEAYMTSTSSARFFGIDESMATSIDDLMFTVDGLLFTDDNSGEYYDLQGRRVKQPAKGVYIYKGKKVIR